MDSLGVGSIPVFGQFGWQFEKRFKATEGTSGVLALVAMGGGFNYGLFVPSFTMVTGVRIRNSWEFGGGPNLIITKDSLNKDIDMVIGFAWVVGYLSKFGNLGIPANLAIVQTVQGVRISFLTGILFSPKKRKKK